MGAILVYQMGRVGSVSVRRALKAGGVNSIHLHYLMTDGEFVSKKLEGLKDLVLQGNRVNKVITLVRDPIARNLSAFFMKVNYKEWDGYDPKLLRKFLTEYNHLWALAWFDLEIKKAFGFDVYQDTQPIRTKSPKNNVWYTDNLLMLILRTENLVNADGILSSFVGKDDLVITKANATKDMPGRAELYKDFLENARLPLNFVEYMYDSKYVRHFYSLEEIKRMTNKWTGE